MNPFGVRSRLTQPNAPFQTSPLRNEGFRSAEESRLHQPDRRASDSAILHAMSSGSEFIPPTRISPTDLSSQTNSMSSIASSATPPMPQYNNPVDLSTIAHSFTFTDPSSHNHRNSSTSRAGASKLHSKRLNRQSRGRSLLRRASLSAEDRELDKKQRELLDSIFGPPLQSAELGLQQQPVPVSSHQTEPPGTAPASSLTGPRSGVDMSRAGSQQQPGQRQRGSSHQRELQHQQTVFRVPRVPASSTSIWTSQQRPTAQPSPVPEPSVMQGILPGNIVPQNNWLEGLTAEPAHYADSRRGSEHSLLGPSQSQSYPTLPLDPDFTFPPLPTRATQAATVSATTLIPAAGSESESGLGSATSRQPTIQVSPSQISSRHPHEPWNLRGSCACFHVQYSIHATPAQLPLLASYCHCTVCRSLSGSNYVAFASVPTSQLRWYAGMPDWRTGRGVDITEELAAARWRFACGLEGKAGGAASYMGDMNMMTGSTLHSPNFTTVVDRDGVVGDTIRLWSGGDKDAVRGSCVRCGSTLFIGYHKEKVVPSLLASPSPSNSPTDQHSQSGRSPSMPTNMPSDTPRRVFHGSGRASQLPSFSPDSNSMLGAGYPSNTQPMTNQFSQPNPFHYSQPRSHQSSPAHSNFYPPVGSTPQTLHTDVPAHQQHRQHRQQQQQQQEQKHYYKTAAAITDVALGSLCDAEDRGVRLVRPVCHVMLRERACWDELPDDGLLRFDGLPGEGRKPKRLMPKPGRPGEDDDDDDENDDDDNGDDHDDDALGEADDGSGWAGYGAGGNGGMGTGSAGNGGAGSGGGTRAPGAQNQGGGAGGGSGWTSWDFGLSPWSGEGFDNSNGRSPKAKGKGKGKAYMGSDADMGAGERKGSRARSVNGAGTAVAARSVDESMRNLGYLMKCIWVYGGY